MATSVIGALRAELSAGVAKFADDMNQAGKQVEKFSKRFRKTGANISRTGQDMSMRMTAPIVAFGGFALKAAGDFEQGMNRVQAVSGATGGQLDALREQAKEMGRTTQFSASQAADAMGFLAMAGFEVDEIIGALPGTLQLAAAAQMDLGSAADIVSNVLSGYGMEVEELGRVNDVLAKTMASANTDLQQLGEAMKMAGPVAASAGVQFEEATAAIGMMGNAGIQATMAGTSLRGAISRMLNPTKAVQGAMEEAGLSFTDAQGKLLPLADIIEQLEPHAENAGLFMELFGQRAGPAMAALVSQGSESLRGLTGELENAGGTAEQIASAQMKGFNGAMRELKSAFEGLQIAIADAGLLEAMTDLIKRLAEWTRNLAESNPQMLKWAAIIAAVVAALGPLVFVIGTTISGIGALLNGVALFIKAAPAFVTAAKGIGAAVSLMGGPITLLITALGALAVAWVTHGEEIQAFVSQWIERLDEAMGGRLSTIINGVVAVVKWFWDQFKLAFTGIVQLLTGDFIGSAETFRKMWSRSWTAVSDIVGRAVGAIGQWIKEKLAAIFDWLGDKIETVKGYFQGMQLILLMFQLPFAILGNRVWERDGSDAAASFVSNSARAYLLLAIPALVGISVLANPIMALMTDAAYREAAVIMPLVCGRNSSGPRSPTMYG
ncbi:MAG TPA: phage tail tape measure protein, partial [Arenicellales bacterium]|nr:phage tail tape measure protein [Arenicellales bacterium]